MFNLNKKHCLLIFMVISLMTQFQWLFLSLSVCEGVYPAIFRRLSSIIITGFIPLKFLSIGFCRFVSESFLLLRQFQIASKSFSPEMRKWYHECEWVWDPGISSLAIVFENRLKNYRWIGALVSLCCRCCIKLWNILRFHDFLLIFTIFLIWSHLFCLKMAFINNWMQVNYSTELDLEMIHRSWLCLLGTRFRSSVHQQLCIGITLRFMITTKTLIRTNWYQIVKLPGLISDVMGFTTAIKKQPHDRKRQKNRIGVRRYPKKYYEYVYSLASKAFSTRTHRETYFFVLSSAYGAHSCLCNNLRYVVLYNLNNVISI